MALTPSQRQRLAQLRLMMDQAKKRLAELKQRIEADLQKGTNQ